MGILSLHEHFFEINYALCFLEIKEEYLQRFIVSPILRRTWFQLPNNRPLVPDRTKRIEGPLQLDYYHMLNIVIYFILI